MTADEARAIAQAARALSGTPLSRMLRTKELPTQGSGPGGQNEEEGNGSRSQHTTTSYQ